MEKQEGDLCMLPSLRRQHACGLADVIPIKLSLAGRPCLAPFAEIPPRFPCQCSLALSC